MESKNLNLNRPENFESKTGDIVGMSFDIANPTSADTAPIMDIDNTTPLFRKTPSTNKGNMLIGDDGILYSTPEALEEANKIYWDNWKKINADGGMSDLSHLRALDGSYHSNPESIKEANRRYREKLAHAMEIGDTSVLNEVKRKELLTQLFEVPNYALQCAGLNFIKQVYQIDPQLAQKIASFILQITQNGEFDKAGQLFMNLVATEMDMQETREKLK